MRKISRIIFAVILCFFLLSTTVVNAAFSFNNDYLNSSVWKNIEIYEINKTVLSNRLSGVFQYYADNSTLTLYTRFSVSESTLNKDNCQSVKIKYNIAADGETYQISLGSEGIESDKEIPFESISNFSNASIGEYICAVHYNGKAKSIKADVEFYSGSRTYKNIAENISLEVPSTTKAPKTTTVKNKTTKVKTTKATTVKPTKFVPKYKNRTTSKSETTKKGSKSTTLYETTGLNSKNETATLLYESYKSNKDAKMTNSAKALLVLGIIAAVLGILSLIVSALIKNKNNSDGKENEDEHI